jgi:hypothetical protein
MRGFSKHEALYLANSVLLFIHEEDSAYWREWELFGLPGGIQSFLAMDIVLIVVGLIGLRYVILKQRVGMWFALLQAACGVLAFGLHESFIWKGHPEFTLPMSQAVLIFTLVVSIAQATYALRELVKERGSAT